MKKLPVLIILPIIGLIILVMVWLVSSKDYQSAKTPMLDTPKPVKAKPVTIWAYADPSMAERYKNTLRELEKAYPNKLTLRLFTSREQMLPILQQASSGGTLPDVFLGEIQDLSPLYQANQLSPISLNDISAHDWIPDVMNPFVRGNNLMAYPSEYSLLVLYFNRHQFDRVGLSYADTHWTWDTLVEIARALYRDPDSPGGVIYGFEYDPTMEWWNALACQYGNGLYEGSRWFWGAPESAGSIYDSLKFLIDLHESYAFCAPFTHASPPPQFVQGKAAMAIAGPALRATLVKNPSFEWGCTVVPRKTNLATPLTARGWAISANTKSLDTAQGVARTLSRIVAEGWLSARSAGQADESSSDYSSVFQISLRYALPPYTGPKNAQVKQIVDRALGRLDGPAAVDANQFIASLESDLTPLKLSSAVPPAPQVQLDPVH